MKRAEVVREVCSVVSLAYHSIGNYSKPSDGFCDKCPASAEASWNFQHSGETLEYVRQAVLAKLKADGYDIHKGFNPISGKEW